jgi:hypothetical protein
MTLSILIFALMSCAALAVVGILVIDARSSLAERWRSLRVARPPHGRRVDATWLAHERLGEHHTGSSPKATARPAHGPAAAPLRVRHGGGSGRRAG